VTERTRRAVAEKAFQGHAAVWFVVNAFLFLIWLITTAPGHPWFLYPAGGWGIALALQAYATYNMAHDDDALEAGEEYRQLRR
jgi:hypothetical protein